MKFTEQEAALKIQGFFSSYRQKKQQSLQNLITENPASQLLNALDLRFQCMKAVAAAKLPINKPIQDSAQVDRVIQKIRDQAKEKGITHLDAITTLFLKNIELAEHIQFSYYDLIWKKSGERNFTQLVNHAHEQLRALVLERQLPIAACEDEKLIYTSEEVLMLARDIIQYASARIIDALRNPELREFYEHADGNLSCAIEQILSNYMMPTVLSKSKIPIQDLVQSISFVN